MGRSPLSGLADTMLGWAADAGRRLRRQLIVLDMHAAVPVSRIVVHQGGGEDGPIARYCHASWDLYEVELLLLCCMIVVLIVVVEVVEQILPERELDLVTSHDS